MAFATESAAASAAFSAEVGTTPMVLSFQDDSSIVRRHLVVGLGRMILCRLGSSCLHRCYRGWKRSGRCIFFGEWNDDEMILLAG
mmetsp:Transcript_1926/g.3520  ORF Transcript_1926/g.3520 Transcript_1926/m.3520 type:complete len:85 (-) Transcript_1926:128-382(-)